MMPIELYGKLLVLWFSSQEYTCLRLSLCCVCESHLNVGIFLLLLKSQCVDVSAQNNFCVLCNAWSN